MINEETVNRLIKLLGDGIDEGRKTARTLVPDSQIKQLVEQDKQVVPERYLPLLQAVQEVEASAQVLHDVEHETQSEFEL